MAQPGAVLTIEGTVDLIIHEPFRAKSDQTAICTLDNLRNYTLGGGGRNGARRVRRGYS